MNGYRYNSLVHERSRINNHKQRHIHPRTRYQLLYYSYAIETLFELPCEFSLEREIFELNPTRRETSELFIHRADNMLPYTTTITTILAWFIFTTATLAMPAFTTPTTVPRLSTSSYERNANALPSDLGVALSQLPKLLPTTKPTNTSTTTTTTAAADEELLARQQTIPAYTPIVTPAPDQAEQLASLGYYQQTYYTCNTIGGNEHCGWHIPVVKAAAGRVGGRVGVVLGVAAGVVGWGVV